MATRRTPSRVRTSAEPRSERPARPLAMQLTESFDQRSPQGLVVTLVGATSHMSLASRSALGHLAVVLADLEADLAAVRAE